MSIWKRKYHWKFCNISQRLPSLKITNIATTGIVQFKGDVWYERMENVVGVIISGLQNLFLQINQYLLLDA